MPDHFEIPQDKPQFESPDIYGDSPAETPVTELNINMKDILRGALRFARKTLKPF